MFLEKHVKCFGLSFEKARSLLYHGCPSLYHQGSTQLNKDEEAILLFGMKVFGANPTHVVCDCLGE